MNRNFMIPFLLILSILMGGCSSTNKNEIDRGTVTVTDISRVSAKPAPPGEPVGERPYEMVLANRQPTKNPLFDFDSLKGWTVEGSEGAVGELFESCRQQLWDSPVARLVYRGESKESVITLRPRKPIRIPSPVTAVTLWMYGNNWGWVPDPTTPRVDVVLLIEDRKRKTHPLKIANVNWKEWWLIHKLVPKELLDAKPLRLAAIQIRGCANKEDRELYFEDLLFYQENPAPIQFDPRPKPGIGLIPNEDMGKKSGPDYLPFPTREKTILPENLTPDFKNSLSRSDDKYVFRYKGDDASLDYVVSPTQPFFRDIQVKLNRKEIAKTWHEAGPVFESELNDLKCVSVELSKKYPDTLHGVWTGEVDGKTVRIEALLRLWQKSLVMDVWGTGPVKEWSYGSITGAKEPELLAQPFLNYHGHHLNVLMSKGKNPFFASVWMDWYRSNASQPYAVDKIEGNRVRLNGGVRYIPKSDGQRNPLRERVFITFSPTFEETLFTIDNPPAKRGKEAGKRLWQESWGPSDYAKEHERSKRLRAYGIEMLTQCNHEITWRNAGESFTFRTMASPAKGGDEALKQYVANQRSLGWRSGLYTNYCDFAPVNAFWNIDRVIRDPSGELVKAWPRCYAPKALYAVEVDRKNAPVIQKKFNTNAAYTDVHTSVSPWSRCDFDARVPGAGTFAATFYAFGELLLHDQDVYNGHCWSEGNHQWLYAGLCTGNYGLAYTQLHLWEYPYLPHFDLLKMHPLSVDVGVPWTARFFEGKEDWSKKENIERSIDQFIAATIAYGHIGWLVEEAHGIRQTCRSYYMLQPLQSRYVMEKPAVIEYGSGNGRLSASEALQTGEWKKNRLYIRYANGLEVWVNGNEKEDWQVQTGTETRALPPYGWLAVQGDFLTGSLSIDGKRFDRVRSPESIFIDGRGTFRSFDGIGTSGSVAVKQSDENQRGLSITAVDGVKQLTIASPGNRDYPETDVRRSMKRIVAAQAIRVSAYDIENKPVGKPETLVKKTKSQKAWSIPIQENAIRYEIQVP